MDIITNKSYKYDVRRLKRESGEFKTVKEFFDNSRIFNKADAMEPTLNLRLFKIVENKPTDTKVKHQNNLLLFHGTSEECMNGILRNGFKNSEKGWHGKGMVT